MTRLRDSIKNAERQAWPVVKDTLAERTVPTVIRKLDGSRQVRSNIRYVVEQTIEALAAAGLLRTPADADVIGKAVTWHDDWNEIERDELHELAEDDADRQLYDAVEAMLDEVEDRPGV